MRMRLAALLLGTALTVPVGAVQVRAQAVDGLFGLMGKMIEEDARNKERRRQMTIELQREDAEAEAERRRAREQQRIEAAQRQAILDAQREAEIALTKRTQSALTKLGLYRAKIDGDRGPTTRNSEAAYRAAFEISTFDLTETDVQMLERFAATGFQSRSEWERASAGGFANRADLIAAEAAGFENASRFTEAKRLGIKTARVYDEYQHSGFDDVVEFASAKRGGFTEPAEYRAAKAGGFEKRDEYLAFQQSGLPTRQAFLDAKARDAKREASRSVCLQDPEAAADPLQLVDNCLTVIQLGETDDNFRAAYASLGSHLKARSARLAAGNLEPANSTVVASVGSTPAPDAAGGSPTEPPSAGAFLQEKANIDLALKAYACGDAALSGRFAEARTVCAIEGSGVSREVVAALRTEAAARDDAARRDAEALAERQRQEAAAEQKRIALGQARERADQLLADVGEFAKARRTLTAPLDVAKAVVAVKQNRESDDVTALRQADGNLEALLEKEPDFQAFLKERITAQEIASTNARTTAKAEIERIETFIRQYVGENILSDHVDDLLALQSSLAAARSSGDAERIMRAQKEGRERIASFDLAAELDRFTLPAKADEGKAAVDTASNGLAVTPSNEKLLKGDPRDILVLGNFTATAPHLVVNLLGETVFDGRRAEACWYGASQSQTPAGRLALDKLRAAGVDTIDETADCQNDGASRGDVLILQRGAFLTGDVLQAKPIVEAFEAENLRLLADAVWSDVGAVAEKDGETAKVIEADLLAGTRTGSGLVIFANGAARVCVVVADADSEAHEVVLKEALPKLERYVPAGASLLRKPLDRAFMGVQRNECSAVYAAARDLKSMIEGAKRAKLDYAIVPVWFEPAVVADAEARIAADADVRNRNVAAYNQEQEAAARLAAVKANEAETVRQREEAALRERYGQEAKAAFNDLSGLAEGYFTGKSIDGKPNGNAMFAALFPQISAWKGRRDADRWEVERYDGHMSDFGTANWKDRRAEVVFAEFNVRSRNRQLGEYSDDCFAVGYLIDAEFNLVRDPVEASCGEAAGRMNAWKSGRAFESRWNK